MNVRDRFFPYMMNVRDRLIPYYVITSKSFITNHILRISVPRDTSVFARDTPIVTIIVTIKVFTIQVLTFRVFAKNIIISD
jgi:hypothetical protein